MNMRYCVKHFPTDNNFGPKLVETKGYISPQKQVEALIYSGQKLELARENEFDGDGEDVFLACENDPTRQPDFDLSMAGHLMAETEIALARQEKEFLKKKAFLQKQKEALAPETSPDHKDGEKN